MATGIEEFVNIVLPYVGGYIGISIIYFTIQIYQNIKREQRLKRIELMQQRLYGMLLTKK